MKSFFKKLGKSKKPKHPSLSNTDAQAVGPSHESTIITTTADRTPSVPANAATANTQAADVTTIHNLVFSSASSALAIGSNLNLAPVARPDEDANKSPSSPDAVAQVNLGSTESEQNSLHSQAGVSFFANTQNSIITGGTFNSVLTSTEQSQHSVGFFANAQNSYITNSTFNHIVNVLPANTVDVQMKTYVHQKPNSSLFFTGRKDVLDKLGKIFLHHADSKSRSSCLLWGMGGIGKTQICLKFTEEMSDRFSHVFWVDASSHDSMTMSLQGISNIPAAQGSHIDGSVQAVLQWISRIQEEWLIVYDNADDLPPEVVARFIPPGNGGNILITSRNPSMGRIVSSENRIEINEMEELDAIALLLKASFLDPLAEHIQAAQRIVTELGCIPLAVDHAGAYIQAGRCDINEYLRQFFLHRQTLMSDAAFTGASNYDQTVYGTWDLSFKEIENRATGKSTAGNAQAAQAAILILQICAFYHHSNISKDIFQFAAEESHKHVVDSDSKGLFQAITSLDPTLQLLLSLDDDGYWDDFIFGQGMSILLSFSLMKREQLSKMFSVHPLVHCWSQERMSQSEQQRLCQMGSMIMACAISWRFTSEDYAFRRMIFPHIKANELYRSQIRLVEEYYEDECINFGLVMWENGEFNNAEQLAVQILEKRKRLLGEEDPKTLTIMEYLTMIYYKQGRWHEAEQLGVQVLDMRKKVLDAEHPDILKSMAFVGMTYSYRGMWNEAEQLEIQVLDLCKKVFGAEHQETLAVMGNLAVTYYSLGRLNEAEQLGVQVLELKKMTLGAEHPETLLSMGNLVMTYNFQGVWHKAEQLGIQLLEMSKKLFGTEHLDTLRYMGNLAITYKKQGRWNEAEQLEIQVINLRKMVLGAEHPDIIRGMGNLAMTYNLKGMWNEAEQLGIQIMEIRKKSGTQHLDSLKNMENLSITYEKQGKWNEAEQLQIQVRAMREKIFGTEHPDTHTSMEILADIYNKQGRWNKAEQLEVQVLDLRKKMLGAENPDTLMSMGKLAVIYDKQGRWNEAEQLGVQVMDTRKKLLGAEHPDTLSSIENTALIYHNQGKWDEAEQLSVQVIDLRKKLFGAEHPDTLASMGNLALTYHMQRRWSEAQQLGDQVIEMKKKKLGATHPDTLTSMAYLALTYDKQGKWNEAEQLIIQVLDMRKKLFGAEHPDTLISMRDLALTYCNQRRWIEAEQLGVQVMNMRKVLLGADHPDTLASMGDLALISHNQG